MDVGYNAPGTFNGDDSRSKEGVNVRIMDIDEILDNDQNMDREIDDSNYGDTDWDWIYSTTQRLW